MVNIQFAKRKRREAAPLDSGRQVAKQHRSRRLSAAEPKPCGANNQPDMVNRAGPRRQPPEVPELSPSGIAHAFVGSEVGKSSTMLSQASEPKVSLLAQTRIGA